MENAGVTNPTLWVFEETGEHRRVMEGDWYIDSGSQQGEARKWISEVGSLAEYTIVKPWPTIKYRELQ